MARTTGWYWPWLLGAGLAGIVGVNVLMAVVASSDASGTVVEPDYYRKAVAWDSTMGVRAASARLGWRATAVLAGAAPGAAALEVRLTDAQGAGVTGATVVATLIHNADAARHLAVPLRDAGDGRYVAAPALSHLGRWEVRIEATRGDARFVAVEHTDLVAQPGDE